MNCFGRFKIEKTKDNHYHFCKDKDAARVKMPEEGSKLKYFPGKYEFRKPFVIYYDFECALQKVKKQKRKETGESYTAEFLAMESLDIQ